MKFDKTIFILMFSIVLNTGLYANISVSNKSIFDNMGKDSIGATTFITNTMTTNYIMSENAHSILVEGNDIINTNDNIATFEYITPIEREKTHPFRYTEVSFFITFPFIYTYSLLAVTGADALQNITPTDTSRSAYRSLQTSELLFTFVGATFAAAAVGYANYSRVYGKQSRESTLNISLSPVVETIGRQTGAGFIFTFSYPYSF